MKITPVPHGLEDILGGNAPDFVRTPGLHMSDLYGSLYKYLEPDRYDTGTSIDPLRAELGFSLEGMLEDALKKRLTADSGRPGEFVEPEYGIIYSPDMIIFNGHTRLGEMKLTWMSSREVPREPSNGFPPKFDKYFTQMKLYCRCLETPYARLMALFVNGDYSYRKTKGATAGPELLAWDITFTRRELDDEWAMVINHAKQRKLL
jgi:hypothetical protein